jgi:CO/xanthine dehydrogenase FAD-binding subunit
LNKEEKMSHPNDYFRPLSLSECLQFLEEQGEHCQILAGGTDLVIELEKGEKTNSILVDIRRLDELRKIDVMSSLIRIGSLVTYDEIENSAILQNHAPVLVAAAAEVGSSQIRHQGTIGGNICTASPAGDAIPTLYVLGAEVVLASTNGNRSLPIQDFFAGVRETVKRSNELVVEFRFPKETGRVFSFFRKVGQRKAQTIAKASVAFHSRINECILEDVKIAMGSVAPTVIFAPKTQAALQGQQLTHDLIAKAAELIKTEVEPIDDIRSTAWYRREVVGGILIEELSKFLPIDELHKG